MIDPADNAEYRLKYSFMVDKGELDGLTPAQCFTLGVEWQMVAQQAEQPAGFSRMINEANIVRISRLLRNCGRQFRINYTGRDIWHELTVAPRAPEQVPR